MINRILYISVVLAQLAVVSSVVFSGLSGWDQAEVNRLEQNTFELNDEITDSNLDSDNQWSEEFENQLFEEEYSSVIGLTIPEYD